MFNRISWSQLPALATVLLAFLVMSVSFPAEAKRLGGGKSFGYQKQVAPKNFNNQKDNKSSQTTPAGQNAGAAAGTAAAGTAAKSGASKWLGPLAGLAAGGLLAAMLFGDGFENLQILDILIFALIAFLLFKLFMGRKRAQQAQEPAYQGYQSPQQQAPENSMQREMPQQEAQSQARQANLQQPSYDPNAGGSIFGADLGESPTQNAQPVSETPDWFDEAGFIEGSKSHFIALQSAWDKADLAALESYCTPDLYQAIQAELNGVQAGENNTQVEELQAEIAAMSVENNYFYVSVRYSGFIDEDGTGAHAFTEIWHIRRFAEGEGNWALAGIQQNH